MKRISKYLLIIALVTLSCYNIPKEILNGKWHYKLFFNGIEVGSSEISNKIVDDNYVSSTEIRMRIGEITTISKESVTETRDFRPLKLESYTQIVNDDQVQKTEIQANFVGRIVELTTNNDRSTYEIDKDFILDGNYFMAKLIEGKFKEGLEVKSYIYHPSIEVEEPVMVKVKVIGTENVNIDGKEESLIHIAQSIEDIKNIDLYIDKKGILKKSTINMLNIKIELIKD